MLIFDFPRISYDFYQNIATNSKFKIKNTPIKINHNLIFEFIAIIINYIFFRYINT